MTTLTKTTGPGGTEFLVRQKLSGGDAAPRSELHVSVESNAFHLCRAVEQAQSEGRHDQLDLALRNRQQFWTDTCRQVLDMRGASRRVVELHRQYGWCFSVPTPRQVQSILDALDSALPSWDRDRPQLFYQTLELNFPELRRLSPSRGRM